MTAITGRPFIYPWILAVALAMALSACSSSRGNKTVGGQAAVKNGYKIGIPYTIRGVKYSPREDFEYDRTGLASWYGDPFHGRKTASGEIYNKWAMTAAHKTLPMPSLVEVTNLENGRKAVLRINDRGPFVSGRIIDLSRAAARKLGVEKAGVAKVRVRILKKESLRMKQLALANMNPKTVAVAARKANLTPKPAPNVSAAANPAPTGGSGPTAGGGPTALTPPPVAYQTAGQPTPGASPRPASTPRSITSENLAPRPTTRIAKPPPTAVAAKPKAAPPPVSAGSGSIFVQAGAFRSAGNAARLRDALVSVGRARIVPADVRGQRYYRVRLGPVASIEQGNRLLARVVGAGYPKARMIVRD